MKANMLKLFVAVLAGSTLLAATLPAEARGDHRRDYREWRHDHRGHGPAWKHGHKHKTVVVHRHAPKRKIVHQHHYYPYPPAYYPAPTHYYSRDPAIVIGVSVPPIVIPIR